MLVRLLRLFIPLSIMTSARVGCRGDDGILRLRSMFGCCNRGDEGVLPDDLDALKRDNLGDPGTLLDRRVVPGLGQYWELCRKTS